MTATAAAKTGIMMTNWSVHIVTATAYGNVWKKLTIAVAMWTSLRVRSHSDDTDTSCGRHTLMWKMGIMAPIGGVHMSTAFLRPRIAVALQCEHGSTELSSATENAKEWLRWNRCFQLHWNTFYKMPLWRQIHWFLIVWPVLVTWVLSHNLFKPDVWIPKIAFVH